MNARHPLPPRPVAADLLHALGRMLGSVQPDGLRLAVFDRIENVWAGCDAPAAIVLPDYDHVHHVRRWADALDDVGEVTLVGLREARLLPAAGGAHDLVADTHVELTGRIPRTRLQLTVRAAVAHLRVPFVDLAHTPALAGWTTRISLDDLRRLDDVRPLLNPLGRA